MSSYTQDDLIERNRIIQSHKLLGNFLDRYSVNHLIQLFNYNLINRYIETERIAQSLDNKNIAIICNLYGEDKKNFSIYIGIKKNNIDFIHLSIHLKPNNLNADKHGMIHFCKDIFIQVYKKDSKLSDRKIKTILSKRIYVPIFIYQPTDKPKSLEFYIDDTYKVTNFENADKYDNDLNREMKAILNVLNRLFNEKDTEYYIGRKKDIIDIHNRTHPMLKIMNTRKNYFVRKNSGVLLGPKSSNQEPIIIKHSIKKNQKTRKVKSKYRDRKGRVNTNHTLIDADKDYQEPGFHESVAV